MSAGTTCFVHDSEGAINAATPSYCSSVAVVCFSYHNHALRRCVPQGVPRIVLAMRFGRVNETHMAVASPSIRTLAKCDGNQMGLG